MVFHTRRLIACLSRDKAAKFFGRTATLAIGPEAFQHSQSSDGVC